MLNKTKCREAYPTDLTDKQWAEIAPLFAGMHKQKWDKRELVNAVFYLVKTGCQVTVQPRQNYAVRGSRSILPL